MNNEEFFKRYEKEHGIELSEETKEAFIKNEFCCESCHINFKDTFEDYNDETGRLLCYDCYEEENFDFCPLCEELYEKPTFPEDIFFVLSKKGASITGLKKGIYQVTKIPFYSASYIDNAHINEDCVRLLKECDIKFPHLYESEVMYICECCAEKYLEKKKVKLKK